MMRIEMLPGTKNVVRFPVERCARPTLALMREIAPDMREVLLIAESFWFDAPAPDLRARVDAETAEYILNQIAGSDGMAIDALDALLDAVVVNAVAACRAAHDASVEAAEAQRTLLQAQTAGGYWMEPLRERAETLTMRTAQLLIEAMTRVEETEGVARAVDLARRGEAWTPRDLRADEAALFGPAVRRAG
jgi:hypothetical protein